MHRPGCIYIIDQRDKDMASGNYNSSNRKMKKRKNKRRKRILIVTVEVLLLLLLLIVLAAVHMLGKIDFKPELDETEAGINQDLDTETVELQEGYTNIAVFGVDNRGSGDYGVGNSDVIMIASIDNATKEVRLVSVYRDTYFKMKGDSYNKANSAYNKGGVTQAVQMLNTNLDMTITQYVTVDWAAVVDAIDALGGVDIELTKTEVNWLNQFMVEIDEMTGQQTEQVTGSGLLHLNGTQATAYSRIRSTAGDDFLRASRQRIVLQAMLDKAKEADVLTLTNACNDIFDDIETNLSLTDIISLAKDVKSYTIISTTGFPFELTTKIISCGDTVIPINLADNVSKLHQYLFSNEVYVPSSTVKNISDTIMEKTGITEDTEAYHTDKYNETVGAFGTEEVKDNNQDKQKQEEETQDSEND